jgi:hypothetical protein
LLRPPVTVTGGEGLGHQGGAERRAGAKQTESPDPMTIPGVPSTGGVAGVLSVVVPAPPGIVMLAPPEVPRNVESAQSERPCQWSR